MVSLFKGKKSAPIQFNSSPQRISNDNSKEEGYSYYREQEHYGNMAIIDFASNITNNNHELVDRETTTTRRTELLMLDTSSSNGYCCFELSEQQRAVSRLQRQQPIVRLYSCGLDMVKKKKKKKKKDKKQVTRR